jgi:hypothetical protein
MNRLKSVMFTSGGTGLVVTVYSYVGQLGYRDTLCTPRSTVGVITHVNDPPSEMGRTVMT